MSDKSSATAERVRGYLVSQLRKNPQLESGVIIDRRTQALGLHKKYADEAVQREQEGEDHASRRQRNLQELERLRSGVFQIPVPELQQSIGRLSLDDFPDLQLLARRLLTIAGCRQSLPPLTSHRDFDGDFFACLKQVLTSPARDVSMLREQVIASLQKRANRRKGKRMIRLMKSQLPELYALEGEWLDTLLRFQPRATAAGGSGGGELLAVVLGVLGNRWILLPLVLVIGRGCIMATSSDDKRSPGYSPPAISTPHAPSYGTADPGEFFDFGDPAEEARRRGEERMRQAREEHLRRGAEILSESLRERKELQRLSPGEVFEEEPKASRVDREEFERRRQEAMETMREKPRAQIERRNRQSAADGPEPGPSSPQPNTTAPFATPKVAPVIPGIPGPRP